MSTSSQAESHGLHREVTYVWLSLFHTSTLNCYVPHSPLQHLSLLSLLSQRTAEWLFLFTHLMPPLNSQPLAARCSPSTENLKEMVNFSNTKTEQAQRNNQHPKKILFTPYTTILHTASALLNTRDKIFPYSLVLRPCFLDIMCPVQPQDCLKVFSSLLPPLCSSFPAFLSLTTHSCDSTLVCGNTQLVRPWNYPATDQLFCFFSKLLLLDESFYNPTPCPSPCHLVISMPGIYRWFLTHVKIQTDNNSSVGSLINGTLLI